MGQCDHDIGILRCKIASVIKEILHNLINPALLHKYPQHTLRQADIEPLLGIQGSIILDKTPNRIGDVHRLALFVLQRSV
jgi:hypothetical protein